MSFFFSCYLFSFGSVVFFLFFLFGILELSIFNMFLEVSNSFFGCDFLLTFLLPYSFFHLLHIFVLFVLVVYCVFLVYYCLDMGFFESLLNGLYFYLNLLDVSWFFLMFLFVNLVSYYVLNLDGLYFDNGFFVLDSYFSLIFLLFGGFSFFFSMYSLFFFGFMGFFKSFIICFLLLVLYICFSFSILCSSFTMVIVCCLISSILSLILISLGFGSGVRSVNLVFLFKFLGDLLFMIYLCGFFEGDVFFIYFLEISQFSVNNVFVLVPLLIYSVGFPFGMWVSFAMGATSYVSCYLHSCGFIASGVMVYSSLLFYGVFDFGLCYDLIVFSSFLGVVFYIFMALSTVNYKEVFGYLSAVSVCLFFVFSLSNIEVALVYFVVVSLIKVIGFSLMDQVKSSVVFGSNVEGFYGFCFSLFYSKVEFSFFWFSFFLFLFSFGFFFMGGVSFCLYYNLMFNVFVVMVSEFCVVIFSEFFLLLVVVGKGFNLKVVLEDFSVLSVVQGLELQVFNCFFLSCFYFGFLWFLLGGLFCILLCFSFFKWNSFKISLDLGLIILILLVFLYFDCLGVFLYDFCNGFLMYSHILSCKLFILEGLFKLYNLMSCNFVSLVLDSFYLCCSFLKFKVFSDWVDFVCFLFFKSEVILLNGYFGMKVIFIFILVFCLLFFVF